MNLPLEVTHNICLFTGHFKLRFDSKVNKMVLVSVINFQLPIWRKFEVKMSRILKEKYVSYLQSQISFLIESGQYNVDLGLITRLVTIPFF